MALTGNKDTDFLILSQLNDNELGKVCQVNQKAKTVCEDDNFWRKRLYSKMPRSDLEEVKNFLKFKKWKEYYIYLFTDSRDGNYLLDGFSKNLDVYEKVLEKTKTVKLPDFIDREQLATHLKREMFLSTEYNDYNKNVEITMVYYKFLYKLNELFSEILGQKGVVYTDINKTINNQLPYNSDIKELFK